MLPDFLVFIEHVERSFSTGTPSFKSTSRKQPNSRLSSDKMVLFGRLGILSPVFDSQRNLANYFTQHHIQHLQTKMFLSYINNNRSLFRMDTNNQVINVWLQEVAYLEYIKLIGPETVSARVVII